MSNLGHMTRIDKKLVEALNAMICKGIKAKAHDSVEPSLEEVEKGCYSIMKDWLKLAEFSAAKHTVAKALPVGRCCILGDWQSNYFF